VTEKKGGGATRVSGGGGDFDRLQQERVFENRKA